MRTFKFIVRILFTFVVTHAIEIAAQGNEKVRQAWTQFQSEGFKGSNVVHAPEGSSKIAVRMSNSTCWIFGQQTVTFGGWISNFDSGKENILSIRSDYKVVGQGFDGFTKTFNSYRHQVWEMIQSTCSANKTEQYNFVGFSRGAAIINILVLTLIRDALLDKERMRLITFGSPRALSDSSSNELHNGMNNSAFNITRVVNLKDPVPAYPFAFLGYKHAGNFYCHKCSYPAKRNNPTLEDVSIFNYGYHSFREYCLSFSNDISFCNKTK